MIEKLREQLPPGWQATLNARDGALMADVRRQVEQAPRDATHLVVSIGGNDALSNMGVLAQPVTSIEDALANLAALQERFLDQYRATLDDVVRRELPTAICTIYDARFPDADLRRVANTGLTVLNDVITREAAVRGLPLVDLRVLFSEETDFANPFEPSAQGGEKLARAILQLLAEHDFTSRRSTIYAKAQ